MKRGEIWTVAGAPDYAGQPRPAVVVQDAASEDSGPVTICWLTTTLLSPAVAGLAQIRPTVPASGENGLAQTSQVMADKISTVPRARLGVFVGTLEPTYLEQLDQALLRFLGLARTSR